MAILPIIEAPDPLLRQKSTPVESVTPEIQTLIDDMFETMYASNGVGLAAPQIGISKRIFVIDIGEGQPFALVNPVLVKGWDEVEDQEGCLSVPGVYMPVKRWEWVVFRGRNEKDRAVELKASGLLARALQHELDHLDGKIFVDLVEDKMILDQELAEMRLRLASKKSESTVSA